MAIIGVYVEFLGGTLQETNISPQKWHFEDDFPFPKVGYVNPLEGTHFLIYKDEFQNPLQFLQGGPEH